MTIKRHLETKREQHWLCVDVNTHVHAQHVYRKEFRFCADFVSQVQVPFMDAVGDMVSRR